TFSINHQPTMTSAFLATAGRQSKVNCQLSTVNSQQSTVHSKRSVPTVDCRLWTVDYSESTILGLTSEIFPAPIGVTCPSATICPAVPSRATQSPSRASTSRTGTACPLRTFQTSSEASGTLGKGNGTSSRGTA